MIAVIDTCVILDAVMERTGFCDDAKRILELVADGEVSGLITVKSLMDLHYVIKHINNNEQETRDILKNILIVLRLVDSCSKDAIVALNSSVNDYEDALMCETAVSIGADCIVTRNLKDYKKSSIKAISPKDFLQKFTR